MHVCIGLISRHVPGVRDLLLSLDTDDEPVLVQLSTVRLERTRDFGDVWLAWGLWRMLGLDEVLEKLIEPGREEVSWSTMAAILTIARFCEPSSELHIADTWYRRTALEELEQQNWRASHAFDVMIKKLTEPREKQRLEITWQRQAKFAEPDEAQAVILHRLGPTSDLATISRKDLSATESFVTFTFAASMP